MRTFQISAMIGENETAFNVQEETGGKFLITKNQKFITRLYKDTDGRWKTSEVSDLSIADVNTLGEEIDIFLNEEQ